MNSTYKEFYFDICHAYTLFNDGNLAYYLYKSKSIPYIVVVRSTDIESFFKYRILLRRHGLKILLNAEKIIFLSKGPKDLVFRKYIPQKMIDVFNDKSMIIPNGLDPYWIDSAPSYDIADGKLERIKRNTLKLLYVGVIDKNKNIETTITAIEFLISEGYSVEFTVVGGISDYSVYERIVNKSFVKYYERKPKQELISFYRENDLFIMPSFKESFGMVYVEAMSQGLPVIYSKGQGFDGQFDDGVVGQSVKSNDAHDICRAIKEVLSADYSSCSKRCIDLSKMFDWAKISQEYIQIYDGIASEKKTDFDCSGKI